MAYNGEYDQRPYHGNAAGRPAPRNYPASQQPPQQQQYSGAPQQHDNYHGIYGYDNYDQNGGYDQNPGYEQGYGDHYSDPGYGRGPPPQQDYRPAPGPGPGRGERPPQGAFRGGRNPPRGGMGPGRGGPRGPAGPGRGGGRPDIHTTNSDPSAGRRYPTSDSPMSPTYGGREQTLANSMSGMNLNGQRRFPPESRGSGNGRGRPDDYGQNPRHEYDYQDPRQGGFAGPRAAPYEQYDDGYGQRPQSEPRTDFGPPGRSMTMPLNDYEQDRMPPPRRTNTMPYEDPAGRGPPQRPSTSSSSRQPPKRSYTQDSRGPPAELYDGGYQNRQEYGQPAPASLNAGYGGGYYDDGRSNGQDHHQHAQNKPSMPNFDNIPQDAVRGSFEQTMRPGPGHEQPQRGAHQTAKLSHAQSQPDLRQPQAAIFEMAGDIPSIPPVPQLPPQHQSPTPRAVRDPVPSRGISVPPVPPSAQFSNPDALPAFPTPESTKSTDSLPAHPTPVRPGQMANSMVNMNDKPPPVRNYGAVAQGVPPQTQQYQAQRMPQARPQQQQQQPPPQPSRTSVAKQRDPPVTAQELEQLRMAIKKNPNDQESALRLARKLIEAADVLVPGVQDQKARGRARERYVMDAHKILKKLANAQNSEAMFVLADCLGRGLFGGGDADSKEAFTLYQSAAKVGHAAAAYRTAVCCEIGHDEGGGTRRDPMKAIQWYKRAASLGDAPAMYKVGMILLKGLLGQPRNPREAVGWLKRAAEKADPENPHSLHELGLLYESAQPNDVIIRDEQYAFTLFQQAADMGYKFSQYRLACAYEYGYLGCPIEPRMSIMWYSKAAQQEEHQAELALSGWYLTGSDGVLNQSDTEAYLWARKAAVAGLAKAEYAMGYFTEVGIGVPANLEDAKRWYWRAAAQDFPKARERLEDLKRTGKNGPRPRERISRSRIERQQEGDCRVM